MVELVAGSIAAPVAAGEGVVVRLIAPTVQCFVTGAGPHLVPNTISGVDPYWLWLAPDRALFVSFAPAPLPEGGFVSDVTDGLAVFEFEGPRAPEIVAMGCTLDPNGTDLAPGRSVQTNFAGVSATLYAHGSRACFRLHVERSLAAYLGEWFAQAASALAGG
jgi:sarcosine oxidase subunit gamma